MVTLTNTFNSIPTDNLAIKEMKRIIIEMNDEIGSGGTPPDLSGYAKTVDLNTADAFTATNPTLETPAAEFLDKVLNDINTKIDTGGTDLSGYYTKTETDTTFLTKATATTEVAKLATKSGLYKDATTPIDLATQCQSLEARAADSATKDELASATDSSTNLMVFDPSTSAQGTLDNALANIYGTPVRMSEQDMNTMATKVAKEIVNNSDYLRLIVKSVTDMITKST